MEFKKRSVSEEIPTSSMADIAFLLIIYFMITTTFAATRGLDWALPQEDDNQQQEIEPEEAVLVEIQPSGELLVDQRPMEPGDIMEYLRPKLERNPQKPVIIRPDPSAPYGRMVEVFDELRGAEERENLKINISIPTQREIEMFWY
jgi:biopolymer transport protein ExbD